MNEFQQLAIELKELTSQLANMLAQQDIEPAMLIINRRLIILESLQNIDRKSVV